MHFDLRTSTNELLFVATFVGVLVDRKRGLNSMKREELNSSQNNVKIEMDWADNRDGTEIIRNCVVLKL